MQNLRAATPALLLALVLTILAACQAPAPQATAAVPAAVETAPSLEELRNARYRGIEEADGEITLTDGRWKGQPYVAGGASRPSAGLAPTFRLAGQLGGNARESAAVLVAANTGGTGDMLYLAVVERRAGQLVNVATTSIGDRVQVREGRIEDNRIVLNVVQAGADDAMCCPGDLVTRRWELQVEELRELAPAVTGRLSAATLAGSEWALRSWAWKEPVPESAEITLEIEGSRASGNAGCNRYFASLADGDAPGELKVGPVGTTRMMCPQEQMSIEARFTRQLAAVRQMRFLAGELALTYELDGAIGVMLFRRR